MPSLYVKDFFYGWMITGTTNNLTWAVLSVNPASTLLSPGVLTTTMTSSVVPQTSQSGGNNHVTSPPVEEETTTTLITTTTITTVRAPGTANTSGNLHLSIYVFFQGTIEINLNKIEG